MGTDALGGVMELPSQGRMQNVIDEGRFARPGDAGNRRQDAEGKSDRNLFEVVGGCAFNDDVASSLTTLGSDGDLSSTRQIVASE